MKQGVLAGIVFILLTCSSMVSLQGAASPTNTFLFVGGSGPGNYTTIHEALEHSHDGDTIFVYQGSYYEDLTINKSISLIGESKETTIINPLTNNQSIIIVVASSHITISRLTIQFNSASEHELSLFRSYDYHVNGLVLDNLILKPDRACILLFLDGAKNLTVRNSFLFGGAVMLYGATNCLITQNWINKTEFFCEQGQFYTFSNNSFTDSIYAIKQKLSWNITISNNSFYNVPYPINLENCLFISIDYNSFEYTPKPLNPEWAAYAIQYTHSSRSNITRNLFRGFYCGIFLEHAYENNIVQNTFEKNTIHARFVDTYFHQNKWQQNYWGRPRILPKPIFGIRSTTNIYPGFFEFDWHPAQQPYY
jgi:parallel beta-helix repeat protein